MKHAEAVRELDALIEGGEGVPPLGSLRGKFIEVRGLLEQGNGGVGSARDILTALVQSNLLTVNVLIVGRAERILEHPQK